MLRGLSRADRAGPARSGGPRLRYAIRDVSPECANLEQGNSSTDHGHAVSARGYQTDSSSKRPAPFDSLWRNLGRGRSYPHDRRPTLRTGATSRVPAARADPYEMATGRVDNSAGLSGTLHRTEELTTGHSISEGWFPLFSGEQCGCDVIRDATGRQINGHNQRTCVQVSSQARNALSCRQGMIQSLEHGGGGRRMQAR